LEALLVHYADKDPAYYRKINESMLQPLKIFKPKADQLKKALDISYFLNSEEQAFPSLSYTAMQSGVSQFVEARACSIVDLPLVGPQFLRDEEKPGTAFIKPILIAGIPLIACATVSPAHCGKDDKLSGDDWSYMYLFQSGVVSRRFARYIRRAVRDIYFAQLHYQFSKSIEQSAERDEHGDVVLHTSVFDNANMRFAKVAMVYPYPLLQMGTSAEDVLAAIDRLYREGGVASSSGASDIAESVQKLRSQLEKYVAEHRGEIRFDSFTIHYGFIPNPYNRDRLVDVEDVSAEHIREIVEGAIETGLAGWTLDQGEVA
jgi:hypothetical protein